MEFDDSSKETNAACQPEQTHEELHTVVIEEHEPEESDEFLRRAKVVYSKMFEEHSKCSSSKCPGHCLPPMASKFLAKLKYPTDAVHMINTACSQCALPCTHAFTCTPALTYAVSHTHRSNCICLQRSGLLESTWTAAGLLAWQKSGRNSRGWASIETRQKIS